MGTEEKRGREPYDRQQKRKLSQDGTREVRQTSAGPERAAAQESLTGQPEGRKK